MDWFRQKILNIPMMVTPLSVMDVSNSYFTGANFSNYNRNSSTGKAYFIGNNITPLDEVYSINKLGEENMKHPFVYQEPIIRDIILEQELMLNDYFLQNRTFTKDRDIECANEMVVGKDVLPFGPGIYNSRKFLYDPLKFDAPELNSSETEKTLSNGDVVVNSGVTLKLEATNGIQFKPGFHAKSGSKLLVKVDGTNPSLRSAGQNDYTTCGRIEKTANNTYSISSPTTSSINWHLKGLNVDLWQSGETFTLPNSIKKGQYSLSAETVECRMSSVVIEAYGQGNSESEFEPLLLEKETQQSLKIVPNPANQSIQLISSMEIETVEIRSATGQSIALANSAKEPINAINISGLSAGMYMIVVKYRNEETETKQLLVK